VSIDLLPDAPPTRAVAVPDRPTTHRRPARPTPRRGLRHAPVVAVHLLCLGVIVLGSRLAFVHDSIRLDEAQSLWQTNHSYRYLLHLVAEDVHPPLYHLLLRTWRLVLGPEVETARALSLVFLLASVPIVYLLARTCLSRNWALVALVVFSCSPFAQWYGNEARMYSMLLFVTLVSQLLFVKVVTTGRTAAWLGYAVAAATGLYVHYFFAFVLVAQGLFLLAVARRLGRGAVLRMVGVAAFVLAAIAPWYLFFRANGSASGTRPSLPAPSSVDFSNVYSQFLFGFQSDAINTTVVSAWPLLVLAALAGVRIGGKVDRATAYLIAAAFVPVLLAFVVSHAITPFFLSRYMAPALPALLIVVVRFLSGLTAPVARVLAVALVAVTITGTVVEAANPETPVEEDYRTAAALAEQATPSDLVVISSPFTVYPFEYYYDGAARVTTLPVWNRQLAQPSFDPATLPAVVDSLTAGHQYVYLLLSYDQGYEETIYQYFAGHFEQTAAYSPSPGLRLLVYRVGYSQAQPIGG
jgi:mannosyltransferase